MYGPHYSTRLASLAVTLFSASLLIAPTCQDGDSPIPTGGEPVRHSALAVSGYTDGWSLVDRDSATAWAGETNETLSVRLSIAEAPVMRVKVHSHGSIRVHAHGKRRDFSGAGWHELAFDEPFVAGAVDLRVVALDANAEVSEIELWGTGPLEAADPNPAGSTGEASAAFHVLASTPSSATLRSTGEVAPPCASFEVDITSHPGLFRRAFLRYRTRGVFRPLAISRSVNGSSMFRGRWVRGDDEANVVEPIDIERLRIGTNRFTFCIPSEASSASVSLDQVELIGELDRGSNILEGAFVAPAGGLPTGSAVDAMGDGSVTLATNEELVFAFERFVRPDAVRFEGDTSISWSATCVGETGATTDLPVVRTNDGPRTNLAIDAAPDARCAGLRVRPSASTSVANLRVFGSGAARRVDMPRIVLASPREHFGLDAWVDGWANAPSDVAGGSRVTVDGIDADSTDGRYGRLLRRTGDASTDWTVTVAARFADGSSFSKQFVLDHASGAMPGSGGLSGASDGLTDAERTARYGNVGQTRSATFQGGSGGKVELGSRVRIEIPDGAIQGTSTITLRHLDATELPPLDPGMINVTAPGAHGYEFLPHGMEFLAPARVVLPYDVHAIPPGYTAADIETFYFDTTGQRWERLARDEVDIANTTIESLTDHFTTMIDAIVVAPEHPQAGSFDPNSMLNAPPANPLAGIAMIAPPSPNNRGDANLSFPLAVPPGRRGLTPTVALTYDSSAGNGWAGVGWNVGTSAVSIDTRWGVPRYDPALESDAYIVDGAELSPNPRDGALRPRPQAASTGAANTTTVFRFRVETYEHVVRHGASPSTYWWEVIGKDGSRRFYGGRTTSPTSTTVEQASDACLTDDHGNIFRWALTEVRDRFGNYVNYTYETDTIEGPTPAALDAHALYLRKIEYTLDASGGHGPYTIRFDRETRPDPILSARGGFKELVRDRLHRIEVLYGSTVVRAWNLEYVANDSQHKSRLAAVEQFGVGGAAFVGNRHEFEYFDEITGSNGDFQGFEAPETSDLDIGELPSGSIVPQSILNAVSRLPDVPHVTTGPSLLGGTRTRGTSVHLYLGFNPISESKSPSLGGAFDFSYMRSEGQSTLVDVDSDGLLDRMQCDRHRCSYNRNLGFASGVASFEPQAATLEGFGHSFFRENSFTFGAGPQVHAYGVSVVAHWTHAIANTTRYLSDVNADGYIDLVANGNVTFGYLDATGAVRFSDSSHDTPVRLGGLGSTLGDSLDDLDEEMRKAMPLIDSVRTWTAPFAGNITIDGTVRLVNDAPGPRLDGVFASVELADAPHDDDDNFQGTVRSLWRTQLTPGGATSGSHSLSTWVNPGETVVFRLNSNVDGRQDDVAWSPSITYDGAGTGVDENGLNPLRFDSAADFALVGEVATVALPYSGNVRIEGSFEKTGTTSDDLTLRIVVNDVVEASIPIAPTQTGTISFSEAIDVVVDEAANLEESEDEEEIPQARVSIELISDTPVDLRTIRLTAKPTATYLSARDPQDNVIAVNDSDGRPMLRFEVPIDAQTFEPAQLGSAAPIPSRPWIVPGTLAQREFAIAIPALLSSGDESVRLTVKRNGQVVYETVCTPTTTLTYQVFRLDTQTGDQLYFTATPVDRTARTVPALVVTSSFAYMPVAGARIAEPRTLTRPYRGFSYGSYQPEPDATVADWDSLLGFSDCVRDIRKRRARKAARALRRGIRDRAENDDPETLDSQSTSAGGICSNLPPFDQMPESHRAPMRAEAANSCAGSPDARLDEVTNPNGEPSPFDGEDDPFACVPNAEARWIGLERQVFVSPTGMGASRLGPDTSPIGGFSADGTARGVTRIGWTDGTSFGGGAYGASIGYGTSFSQSRLDFEDLNGDEFPDVFRPGNAQYSLPNGNLGASQPVVETPRVGDPTPIEPGRLRATGSRTASYGYGASLPGRRGNGAGQEGGSGPTGVGQKSTNSSTVLPVSVSGGHSASVSQNNFDLLDVNGDGLLDRVIRSGEDGDHLHVALNLGYSFAPAEPWGAHTIHNSNSYEVNAGVGFTSSDQAWGGGVQGSLTRSQLRRPPQSRMPDLAGRIASRLFERGSTLLDINHDGLIDVVRPTAEGLGVHLNTGSGFEDTERVWRGGNASSGNDSTVEVAESDNISVSASAFFTVGLGPLCLPLKLCYVIINPGGGASENATHPTVALRDIDGDGALDHVISGDSTHMTVALNRIGRTGLLRAVKRPLGSRFDVDYERAGNTREMPSARWVVSRVVGFDGMKDSVTGEEAGDYQATRIRYDEGRYERRDRTFLGFGTVTIDTIDTRGWAGAQSPSPDEPVFRRSVSEYVTSNVPMIGFVTRTRVFDGAGALYSDSAQSYVATNAVTGATLEGDEIGHASSVFVGLFETIGVDHEPGSTVTLTNAMRHHYDAFGNLETIDDLGREGIDDDRHVHVVYSESKATCATNHIVGVPIEILVRGSGGALFAHRTATIDCTSGAVTDIATAIDAGSPTSDAIESMSYTANGNLETYTGPKNASGDRYFVTYGYDEETRSHVTSMTDAYGESASAHYDPRFGVPDSGTDTHGVAVTTTLDSLGRPTKILGPLEAAAGADYTVSFDYHPEASHPYAITRQMDLARDPNNPIETIVITDVTGRTLQAKHDATVHVGDGMPTRDVMVVSGRTQVDAFGRTVASWYPTEETKASDIASHVAFAATPDTSALPTRVLYDALGRARDVTLPDATHVRSEFAIFVDGATQVAVRRVRTIDALARVSEALVDGRGQQVGTVEHLGDHEIRTTYGFDSLSRLVRVTDAANHVTRVGFDLGGRRTEIASPDAGRTSYTYDAAGNLVERTTPNLRGHDPIRYGYHFGRLTSVTYPQHPDSNVAITYGTAADGPNATGRIAQVSDRAGTTAFVYDALGRATRETRTVGRWNGEDHMTQYVTQSSYDTWGRVQQMVYPDGEVLTYAYDSGGQVRSAEGTRFGTNFPYVRALEYDRFGAMVYEVDGNGTVSHRSYDATTRRIETIEAGDFQNVSHDYDAVGQLTGLLNDVTSRRSDRYGGRVEQHFTYDALERLTSASGTWNRPEGGTDSYSLGMAYDDVHNITRKRQTHEVTTRGNSHPIPQHATTYDLTYAYGGTRPHAPTQIGTATFEYDANGNQTEREDQPATQRRRTEWDEESLPRAITVAGHRTEFVYDSGGTRVAKSGAQGETVYVNPTWTVRNGSMATKHIYVGGRRVASKILPGAAPAPDDPDLVAGMLGRWYEHRSDSGNEHASNTTMNPHYRVTSSMPTNGTPESNFVYFYHGDMIGSVSYVTDKDGELFEHNQFFASGEPWVRQNSNSERLPFLFTAGELDQETDLYAFGVRMYDPREQVWLSPDPALPMFLAGQGNSGPGVFAPRTLGLYGFAFNNPVMFDDPSGLEPCDPEVQSCVADDGAEVIPWTPSPAVSSATSPGRGSSRPSGSPGGPAGTPSDSASGRSESPFLDGGQFAAPPSDEDIDRAYGGYVGLVPAGTLAGDVLDINDAPNGYDRAYAEGVVLGSALGLRYDATLRQTGMGLVGLGMALIRTRVGSQVGAPMTVAGGTAISVATASTVGHSLNLVRGMQMLLSASIGGEGGGGGGGGSPPQYQVRRPGVSGAEGAKNIPSWAQGQRPLVGESGNDFARRLMNSQYGAGNWHRTNPGSEYSQLKKFADRSFQNP